MFSAVRNYYPLHELVHRRAVLVEVLPDEARHLCILAGLLLHHHKRKYSSEAGDNLCP